jgi:diketogulonate reductase-like aldo/keto reductase
LQRGALPLPKASGQKHQEEKAKVDFEISQEDMEALNHLKHIRKNLW